MSLWIPFPILLILPIIVLQMFILYLPALFSYFLKRTFRDHFMLPLGSPVRGNKANDISKLKSVAFFCLFVFYLNR